MHEENNALYLSHILKLLTEELRRYKLDLELHPENICLDKYVLNKYYLQVQCCCSIDSVAFRVVIMYVHIYYRD